ncbi:hypothetical protein CBL_20844 [Carabus blaptoides fortunei]
MNTTSDADISPLLGLKEPTIDQVIQLTKLQDSKIKELAKTIQRQQAQIDILISDLKDKDETIRDLLGSTTDETASESAMSTTSTTTTSQVKQQKEATPSLSSTNSRKRSRTTKLQHTAAKKPATDITIQSVAAPTKKTTQSPVVNANNHPQSQEPSQTSVKASKIPPIILRTKTDTLKIMQNLSNNGIKIKEAVNRADCIKIRVDSINDYRKTTKIFDNTNTSYHTYQLSEEKALKVVIRGIPEDIEASEVMNELVAKGYPVISATRMKGGPNRKPLPLILVQLTKPAGKEIFELTNLLQQRQQQQLPRHQEQQQQTQQEKHATQANPSQPINSSDKRTYAQATSGNQTKNHANNSQTNTLIAILKTKTNLSIQSTRQKGTPNRPKKHIRRNYPHNSSWRLKLNTPELEQPMTGPNKYTHYPYNGKKPDILDIAILQNVVYPFTMTVTSELNSDHEPVQMDFYTNEPTSTMTTTKTSWPNYTDLIQHSFTIRTNIHTPENLEEEVEKFTNILQSALNKSQYSVNHSPQRTPITDTIKTLIKSKNRARRKWQRTLNPEDKRAANQLKEQVTQSLKEYREKSWQEKITTLSSEDNSVWKMSKTLRNTETKIPPIHSRTGLKFTPTDKIEAFADSLELQFSPNDDNMNINHVERNRTIHGLLLGDGGYPCRSFLLTPITHAAKRYNASHISTRGTVERCFGHWKAMFRSLQIGLNISLDTAIAATAVIYNIKKDCDDNDTGEQKRVLIEFLKQNPKLLSGKFSSDFTVKTGVEKHGMICDRGQKEKKSKITSHSRATGGGSAPEECLNEVESEILQLITPVALEGHQQINESVVEIDVPVIELDVPTTNTGESFPAFVAEEVAGQSTSALDTPIAPKRKRGIERLEKSVVATQKLAEQLDRKMQIKKEYCDKKLALLERKIMVKERIAIATEKIAESLHIVATQYTNIAD